MSDQSVCSCGKRVTPVDPSAPWEDQARYVYGHGPYCDDCMAKYRGLPAEQVWRAMHAEATYAN